MLPVLLRTQDVLNRTKAKFFPSDSLCFTVGLSDSILFADPNLLNQRNNRPRLHNEKIRLHRPHRRVPGQQSRPSKSMHLRRSNKNWDVFPLHVLRALRRTLRPPLSIHQQLPRIPQPQVLLGIYFFVHDFHHVSSARNNKTPYRSLSTLWTAHWWSVHVALPH